MLSYVQQAEHPEGRLLKMNRNVRAEMVRYGLTAEDLAAWLSISTVSVSNKLNNKRPWTLPEAKTIVDRLNKLGANLTIESLFFDAPVKAVL